jgi:plasmid stabilization system protein ParE
MTTVVVVDQAGKDLAQIHTWWVENRRSAPELFLLEFERCISLIGIAPEAGSRFRRTHVLGVRRLVLKRTRHLVYYVYDRTHDVAYVIAVWGAPKEGDPVLTDPLR